jgi:hypothetical protein
MAICANSDDFDADLSNIPKVVGRQYIPIFMVSGPIEASGSLRSKRQWAGPVSGRCQHLSEIQEMQSMQDGRR